MRRLPVIALALLAAPAPAPAAEPPALRELRTQTADGVTYFHARFDRPAGLWTPQTQPFAPNADREALAKLPELVPQNGQTRAVYWRGEIAAAQRRPAREGFTPVPPVEGLQFVGRRSGDG